MAKGKEQFTSVEEMQAADRAAAAEKEALRRPPKTLALPDITLYQDDDYLVVNKPPLVSTLDERASGFGEGMLKMVRRTYPDAQAAHRLDKETSGALAFALNPAAYRHLAMQFEHREVTKIYHAICQGVHKFEDEMVTLPILQMPQGYVVIDRAQGKPAETIFKTREVFARHTLVGCLPITGRMHQIRIHLSSLKAPIVYDTRYGGKPLYLSDIKRKFKLKGGTEEMPLISRVALHAAELNFARMDGERVHAIAPYPKDMEALLAQLRKNS